ncbi:hypothetical protein H4R22_002112 [Coemansia sp. RSA 1290]|nr:hypothetical protein H4R22_002112 [Coemansia sp. RSA 1290]KAJ2671451.1 hypothetical protein IWW42_003410 [Coemansia sp. RSA 1085]
MKVTVEIANLTSSRIRLTNVEENITREQLDALIEKKAPGSSSKKYRIGTRSMGNFTAGMELRDFGNQNTIYLEKL